MQSIPKLICSSLLLSLCVTPCYAQSSAETVIPEAKPDGNRFIGTTY